MTGFIAFIIYFFTAIALLAAFVTTYVHVTPYSEFAEIRKNNPACAISLTGAIIGFTLPLVSVIFYTHHVIEMIKWAVVTGVVQLAVFIILGKLVRLKGIEDGEIAPATILAGLSVAVGMLNAICISY